jgi:hypothetical protein
MTMKDYAAQSCEYLIHQNKLDYESEHELDFWLLTTDYEYEHPINQKN